MLLKEFISILSQKLIEMKHIFHCLQNKNQRSKSMETMDKREETKKIKSQFRTLEIVVYLKKNDDQFITSNDEIVR